MTASRRAQLCGAAVFVRVCHRCHHQAKPRVALKVWTGPREQPFAAVSTVIPSIAGSAHDAHAAFGKFFAHLAAGSHLAGSSTASMAENDILLLLEGDRPGLKSLQTPDAFVRRVKSA